MADKLSLVSILLVYELIGERTDVFFIPDGNQISSKLRSAISSASDTIDNGEQELTAGQLQAHEVIVAATTDAEGRKHLEKKYHALQGELLPYKLIAAARLDASPRTKFFRIGVFM